MHYVEFYENVRCHELIFIYLFCWVEGRGGEGRGWGEIVCIFKNPYFEIL